MIRMSKPSSSKTTVGGKGKRIASSPAPAPKNRSDSMIYEVAWASPTEDGKLIVLGMVHGSKMNVEQAKIAAAKKYSVEENLVRVRRPLHGEKEWK